MLFGPETRYLADLKAIKYHPMYAPAPPDVLREVWDDGVAKLRNVISTMREELLLFGEPDLSPSPSDQTVGNQVFVVHGHDQAMKEATARSLGKLGLTPVILHEQPSEGRTVIEKFTDYANVGYAVVLLSPDDLAYDCGPLPRRVPPTGHVRMSSLSSAISSATSAENGFLRFTGSMSNSDAI